jgi:hypothetical protein
VLDQTVALPDEAAEVALEVHDLAGERLGHLGQIHLGSR